MLAINMDDVINVLNSCKPYLIGFAGAAVLVLIAAVACGRMEKPAKKLGRTQAGIALLLALITTVNLICFIPMSSLISLATGNGTISEEISAEATELCTQVAEEGIVLLKNENILPLERNTNLNVFGWASTNPCYGGTGSGSLSDAYETYLCFRGWNRQVFI